MSASPPPIPPPPPTGLPVENRGPQLLAVGYTLLATSLISTVLRCYVRVRVVKSFGLDDWFMVAAIISFTFYVICGHVGVIHGTGRHFADLEIDDIRQALLYWWLCTISFAITMVTAKISIALFLLRFVVTKIDTWIIYATAGFNVISMIVFAFVAVFQCKPISFFWDRMQLGTCIDVNVITALTYFNSTLSFVSDFACAMVALVLVWKLNMSWKKKAVLSPILSMGFLASIAVVARFAYVEKFKDPDFLWATFDIAIWSSMEQGLAITASSLATLRPLVRAVGKKLGHSWWGASEDQGSELPRSSRSNKWELKELPRYSIRQGFQAGKPFNLTPPKRPERCVVISPPYSPSADSDDLHQYMPPSPEDSISTWYYQTIRRNESEEALTAMENRRMRRMNSADIMGTHTVRIYDDTAQKYI